MDEPIETSEVPLDDKNVVNVILFGETGVGKSTLVNAIANYLKYANLEEASEGKLLCAIPMKFKLMNDDFVEEVISFGESENEVSEEGASSTQNPKTYILKIPERQVTLRIIDTPGIGDTRGLEYDERNTEKILALLGELDHVNAFCLLLKPNHSRFTVLFDYCVKHLMSKLDKKVYENFVFVFTNARSSFFTPGDTFLPLKAMLERISVNGNKIPFNKNNTFCVDNESVRYLVAKNQGIRFTEKDRAEYSDSWKRSSDTVLRMIDYIKTLTPVSMMGTLSINEARRIIFKLATPIIDVMQKCEDAKESLMQHERTLLENQSSLIKLKPLLTIPVIRYDVTETREETTTPNKTKPSGWHLSWTPPFIKYRFGTEKSITHKVVTTTITKPFLSYEPAANIKPLVEEKEELKATMVEVIKQLKSNIKEYDDEAKVLIDAVVRFTVFLQENAIVYGNDFFKNELINLIKAERRANPNGRRLESYENLLSIYLDKVKEVSGVTAEQVRDIKNKLLGQKHFGEYLKFFFESQIEAPDTEL